MRPEGPRPFFTTLRALLDREGETRIGDLLHAAKEQTYGLLILLLALPSLIPGINVGTAPLGGLAMIWIGLQMVFGKRHPYLPNRIRNQCIQKGRLKEALARLEGFLDRFGGEDRTRRTLNQRWMGLLVTWTALLLTIPVPLPFGNILPASILALLGAALLEERPAWVWLGALGSLFNTVYFALSFDAILRALHRTFHIVRLWFL